MDILPGTNLEVSDMKLGFEYLAPSIAATGGLTLAQVSTITGLEQSTTQNWIKRGWVAHPVNKRYGEYQLARIMLLNMLRPCIQLDNIAFLLRYVNGEADDRGDDLIPDSKLYTHLCLVISECEKKEIIKPEAIRQIVDVSLDDYREVYPGAKEKVSAVLTAMTLGYISAEIKKDSDRLIEEMKESV